MRRWIRRARRSLRRRFYPAALRRADERVVLAALDAIEAAMWREQAAEYRRRAIEAISLAEPHAWRPNCPCVDCDPDEQYGGGR
ncbi:hypothetical protein [Amycolatopsis sp. NPDC051371]|uniref:hypothetical protein n=1 Tax=Amycolatopsis sp. NPDC051371 TaxID=3155800 RepID=UPI003443526E